MNADDYLDLRLDEFLERVSAEGGGPGGGSAAAFTVAVAAGLVAMVARCSGDVWGEAGGIAAQAGAIGSRAVELAQADATAWEDALAALREAESSSVSDERRSFRLERKLDLAAAVPLEIAELGATAAELAALAAEHGEPAYRADAAAAAALAAGGARAGAHLVRINLVVREGEERLVRARRSEEHATDAAERALGVAH